MATIITKSVVVTITVKVTVDADRFTPEFANEFSSYMWPVDPGPEDHFEHLGQLYARGIVDNRAFIEGYGPAQEMGIRFEDSEIETHVHQSKAA